MSENESAGDTGNQQSPDRDTELEAIQQVVAALEKLDAKARKRVIEYAASRYGIAFESLKQGAESTKKRDSESLRIAEFQKDIRSLKEQKKPETAVEMAVIVAYYLTEYSPISERKSAISSKDLKPYFNQANFLFPKSWKDVLPNAKKAGYLDSIGSGAYKLNSVGYNLVVHALPRKSTTTRNQ